MGRWDDGANTFTINSTTPNAVKVAVRREKNFNEEISSLFAGVLGIESFGVAADVGRLVQETPDQVGRHDEEEQTEAAVKPGRLERAPNLARGENEQGEGDRQQHDDLGQKKGDAE